MATFPDLYNLIERVDGELDEALLRAPQTDRRQVPDALAQKDGAQLGDFGSDHEHLDHVRRAVDARDAVEIPAARIVHIAVAVVVQTVGAAEAFLGGAARIGQVVVRQQVVRRLDGFRQNCRRRIGCL